MKNTKHLAIISATLIIISLILGSSFKNAFEHLNTIKTTGSAKKDFIADIIIWDGSFSTKNMELEEAYKKLDLDKNFIIAYLSQNNVKPIIVAKSNLFIIFSFINFIII